MFVELYGRLNLDGDVKKTRKLSWLADSGDDLVPLTLVDLDFLITVPKLEPEQKLEDVIRKKTWIEVSSRGGRDLQMQKFMITCTCTLICGLDAPSVLDYLTMWW